MRQAVLAAPNAATAHKECEVFPALTPIPVYPVLKLYRRKRIITLQIWCGQSATQDIQLLFHAGYE